jgi:hypothetical protein
MFEITGKIGTTRTVRRANNNQMEFLLKEKHAQSDRAKPPF